jgi:transcriptional regulator with XRE-family HTH domain
MPNDRLRSAMAAKHISAATLADRLGVDPKTVQRWVSGREPHASHRWQVAQILGERADYLWPDGEQNAEPRRAQTAEVLAAYAHRSDVAPSVWWQLLSNATQHIDLLGYAMLHFLPEMLPDVPGLLKDKGASGCSVRIALGDPDSPRILERDLEEQLGGTLPARIRTTLRHFRNLWDAPGVEIRYHTAPLYNSVFRADDEMHVTPHLYSVHGSRAPLLHLRRLGPHGIFEGFVTHFEAIWATARPAQQELLPGIVRTLGRTHA